MVKAVNVGLRYFNSPQEIPHLFLLSTNLHVPLLYLFNGLLREFRVQEPQKKQNITTFKKYAGAPARDSKTPH